MIVRVRVDHIINLKSLTSNYPDFALWYSRSMAAIVIPQPGWDFLDTMPAVGGYQLECHQDGGNQYRRGWGPPEYMQFT
ncbi:hypothetical protein COCSUDRAFT_54962 [Coccomyxa subellipsoidea C-169]|uniref:Uncharacterized protein n=1 Tax=Coccomyxa subellipsoidea (strain C-169) TaxID=574566 RepID=I0YJ16_COCSC|nr:hypothetical protein COCSUDRAFT_54962 [Coccomyxa subellipsoidea C-169]EIE18385.1 hypothetical protein COCSUDRAFT_54962 [Coccomyxa subellipsoidea C-169]|eukprot:XP_005642929.1 hypothetical protein COCSUDRAFT_54962 [Coccomyxa subellipsoidea C-169]